MKLTNNKWIFCVRFITLEETLIEEARFEVEASNMEDASSEVDALIEKEYKLDTANDTYGISVCYDKYLENCWERRIMKKSKRPSYKSHLIMLMGTNALSDGKSMDEISELQKKMVEAVNSSHSKIKKRIP